MSCASSTCLLVALSFCLFNYSICVHGDCWCVTWFFVGGLYKVLLVFCLWQFSCKNSKSYTLLLVTNLSKGTHVSLFSGIFQIWYQSFPTFDTLALKFCFVLIFVPVRFLIACSTSNLWFLIVCSTSNFFITEKHLTYIGLPPFFLYNLLIPSTCHAHFQFHSQYILCYFRSIKARFLRAFFSSEY